MKEIKKLWYLPKPIRYLYYKLYRGAGEGIKASAAAIVLWLLLFFNIFTIMNIYSIYYNVKIDTRTNPNIKWTGLPFLFLLNYLVFLKNKKYRSILYEFRHERKRQRIIGNIVVIIYVILSTILVFYTSIMKDNHFH